jgi:uncharacterized protein YgiM (DUF1202 family)
VRFNLQFVRKQALGTDAPAGPWLDRTLRALTLNEWTALVSTSFWICFGLLAMGQWKTDWKCRMNLWVGASAVATVFFGFALAGAVRLRYFEREAVIVAREVAVRNGPLDESKPAFTARDGTEVKVLDQLNGWWQVKDLSGRVGWVRQVDAIMLSVQ